MRLSIVGPRASVGDHDFWSELSKRAEILTRGKDLDIVLFFATRVADLEGVPVWRERIAPNGAIWVIYPKGVTALREADVRSAGKQHGLVDVKIASFSDTHSSMKVVIPVAQRSRAFDMKKNMKNMRGVKDMKRS